MSGDRVSNYIYLVRIDQIIWMEFGMNYSFCVVFGDQLGNPECWLVAEKENLNRIVV